MTYQLKRRHLLIALLISLFFHVCLFIHFASNYSLNFFPSLQKKDELHEQITKKNDPRDDEWVETKTRSGQFGADVIFSDIPDDEINPSLQEAPENDLFMPHSLNQTLDTQQNVIPLPETPKPAKQITAQTPHKKTSSPRIQPQQKIQRPPSKPLVMPKQLPTLAQLTQGILNYAQESGNYSVSMLGKKNGIPNDKQLQYERYLQKINLCINNSVQINKYSAPQYYESHYSTTVSIAFNRDGSLNDLRLLESCGDPRWDAFWMHVLREANGSYPPVPRHLTGDPLRLGYVLTMKG
jgi:outer membrane biosynthesis protein TonB